MSGDFQAGDPENMFSDVGGGRKPTVGRGCNAPVLETIISQCSGVLFAAITMHLYGILAAVKAFFPMNSQATFPSSNCKSSEQDLCWIIFESHTMSGIMEHFTSSVCIV